MTIEITKKETVDIKFLQVSAGVRYWEDGVVCGVDDEEGALIPHRVGDRWEPKIEIESGRIVDWPANVSASLHYKVCDDGKYSLLNESCSIVLQKEGYVPDVMCPKEEGYGDYIIMDINEEGFIQNWKPDLSYFTEGED